MVSLSEFYNNKKIYVTGHSGFKGAWLCAILHRLKAKIFGYSLAPKTIKDLYNFLPKSIFTNDTINNILNYDALKNDLHLAQPDILFHFAAQPLVRESYKNPLDTFNTNIIGTSNILEIIKGLSQKCVVVCITTDKVYENQEWDYPYRENDRLGGYDPYSASKAAAELVIKSFSNSFFNINNFSTHQKSICSVRAGNVVGGGDWSVDRLIPDVIKSIQNNQILKLRNPEATRPWQHVLEPLTGYLLLAEKVYHNPILQGAYNFGPLHNEELKVSELIKIIQKNYHELQVLFDDNPHPHEAGKLALDISKVTKTLNWKPQLNANDTIQWTFDWYFQNKTDIFQFTKQQIDKYFSLFNKI